MVYITQYTYMICIRRVVIYCIIILYRIIRTIRVSDTHVQSDIFTTFNPLLTLFNE